ncbi:Prophage tail fiber assembly protein TfaE [Fundidesulfovibrio magnetotacticus]|uniref:Prophage tail fiber assembly protein TfaE n=1 Tax=Fundidesulfovibrio magnetotacticus TaxID=2730080 RepID=A0A6V8LWF9_9BACT|nr:hypothetical protein [Fundidesulfovibrio magnetotacticus]GFK94409.1 Prophage tail fiber assembly protein TfaE [Fundidesulfovibrio magnetotacticus]
MQVYLYDDQGLHLRAYTPPVSPARPQQEDGSPNYLFPANCTAVAPPETGDGQAAVFDAQANAWRVVEDHRGKIAWGTATRQPLAVQSLGPLPEGCTLAAPPTRFHVWSGQDWQPDMAAVTAYAEAVIDAQADQQLSPYMSLSAGRAMTYMAKEAQARAFLAASEPVAADYPLIAGEVGITGATPREVAETILAMSQAWHSIGAAIEAARLAAKKQVREAASPEAVQAVLDSLTWPAPGQA